jgi:amino acid adenylation domain-containing protein
MIGSSGGPIRRRAAYGPAPLSFAQERLWFLEQLQPGQSLYVVPVVLRFSVAVSAGVLKRALDEIVRRHEVLRSAFVIHDEQPSQVVAEHAECPFRVVDLRGVAPEARDTATQDHIAHDAATPFDLTVGCRLRATFVSRGEHDHVLVCTFHHTAFDGWSTTPFVHELTELYAAFARGAPSPLPSLPIQYSDYAWWQRQMLADETRRGVLVNYWRQQLANLLVSEVPPDFNRPSRPSYRVGRQGIMLPAATTAALKMLAQRESVTPFMVLLAAVSVAVQRYSANDDVCVGTSIAGRSHSELERLIGCCLNTLVLRVDLTGDPTVASLLQRVRETCLQAFAHQSLPFELLLQELAPARDLSRTPLFQVYVNYLNVGEFDPVSARSDIADTQGTTAIDRDLPREGQDSQGPFDLALYARSAGDELALSLFYARDLFKTATAVRLLRDIHAVLRDMATCPDERMSRLSLAPDETATPPAPVRHVPAAPGWQPWSAITAEKSIGARFVAVANDWPDRIAIRTATTAVTFRQLEETSSRIATALRSLVSAGDRVALLLAHDETMLAAVIGVLRSGAAYVPLDAAHPVERLRSIVTSSRPATLLVDRPRAALATSIGKDSSVQIVFVDDIVASPAAAPAVAHGIDGDALAYLLYTSGSTGQPKGVMQSHRNVLRHIRVYADSIRLTPADSLTLLSSYGFDAAVMDIFGALLTGATLLVIDLRADDTAAQQALLADATILHATPTVFRHLAGRSEAAFGRTRVVVLGGEPATRGDVDLFSRCFPNTATLVNGLGPTESTLALQCVVDSATDIRGSLIPVGYPVDGTEVSLVNVDRREVGALAVGEIALRSTHVALGYWDDEAATARAFASDSSGAGLRTYFTGDLARRDRSGRLEFIGRRDTQVKLRGVRIEVAEIEQRLLEYHGVTGACVAPTGTGEERQLVAYLVCARAQLPDAASLRRFLRQQLPEVMVPAHFVVIDRLPLTVNGKIDRRALPSPASGHALREAEAPEGLPMTATEQRLAGLWREVLRVSTIHRTANFFDLGGHSLLAMQVISRLRATFQREVPLRAIFEAPTLQAFASVIDAAPLAEHAAAAASERSPARVSRERYKVRLS